MMLSQLRSDTPPPGRYLGTRRAAVMAGSSKVDTEESLRKKPSFNETTDGFSLSRHSFVPPLPPSAVPMFVPVSYVASPSSSPKRPPPSPAKRPVNILIF